MSLVNCNLGPSTGSCNRCLDINCWLLYRVMHGRQALRCCELDPEKISRTTQVGKDRGGRASFTRLGGGGSRDDDYDDDETIRQEIISKLASC